MDDRHARDTARLAVGIGVVALGSAACLATYFAVRGPFGTINDVGNASVGVLSAALAWRLRPRGRGTAGTLGVAAAVVGAALTVVGSALVVSGTTGFFLAGLVSSVGFAATGTWLVVLSRADDTLDAWPRRLRTLGILAGGLMALGFAAAPGILLGLDDEATAPGWAWIGFVGWLGIYVAYPVWTLWYGAAQMRRSRRGLRSKAATA